MLDGLRFNGIDGEIASAARLYADVQSGVCALPETLGGMYLESVDGDLEPLPAGWLKASSPLAALEAYRSSRAEAERRKFRLGGDAPNGSPSKN